MLIQRRNMIKARLLKDLQKAEREGKTVRLAQLAERFRCSVPFLHSLRRNWLKRACASRGNSDGNG